MAQTAKPVTLELAPGDIIWNEGDDATVMYVVQSGEVEIVRYLARVPHVVQVVPAGEFFGETGLINGRPRATEARARTDVRLLELHAETFENMVRSRAEIAIRTIKTMAMRLDRANEQIELLLRSDPIHRVVECVRMLAESRGIVGDDGNSVTVPADLAEVAATSTVGTEEVARLVGKLQEGQVLQYADGQGFTIGDVGKLFEFLDFLDLKEHFDASA